MGGDHLLEQTYRTKAHFVIVLCSSRLLASITRKDSDRETFVFYFLLVGY